MRQPRFDIVSSFAASLVTVRLVGSNGTFARVNRPCGVSLTGLQQRHSRRRFSTVTAAFFVLALFGFLCGFLSPQIALGAVRDAPPANCSQVADPWDYTRAALDACNIPTFSLTSTTQLPDGGTSYNYDLGAGGTLSLPVPPSGFDPATAPESELALYALPPRPPQSDLNNYSAWVAGYSHARWSQPLSWVAERAVALIPPPKTTSTGNWAGFDAWTSDMANYFTTVDDTYSEPHVNSGVCGSSQDVAWWDGIGGISDWFGQNGTDYQLGVGHYAWAQVWNNANPPVNKLNILLNIGTITHGDTIRDYVSWSPSEQWFAGSVNDLSTGGSQGWIYTNANITSGHSAELILEKSGGIHDLGDFGTWGPGAASINGTHTFSAYSPNAGSDPVRERDVLATGTATTGSLNSNGSFTVSWVKCN